MELINQIWDNLTVNEEALKKLPNYQDVLNKLEKLNPGESKKLITDINTQLWKISNKVIQEQWVLSRIWSLVWVDSWKMDKLKLVSENYSRELQNMFKNFDKNNHYAWEELLIKISSLWNNPNLTKLADFTKTKEENKKTAWLWTYWSWMNLNQRMRDAWL